MQNTYRSYLESVMAERHIPGASVLVRQGQDTLFHEGLGFADRAENRKVTADTVFGVASITKSFTCLAIMQLADAGKLDIDRPVADYLPAFTRSGSTDLTGITVHHLMSNSSGLPPMGFRRNALARSIAVDPSRELLGLNLADHQPPIDTVDELVDAITTAGIALLRPPGETFSYSNEGFALLGRIIEVASGTDYVSFVTSSILEPLGMTRSVFSLEDLARLDDVSNLYSYIGSFERVEETPGYYWAPAMLSAGYLRTTSGDLSRYADVFLGRSESGLASPAALARMMEPHVRVSRDVHYGYGLMVQPDYQGHKVVRHGGSTKGVGSNLSMLPALGLVGITLTNITGCPVEEMNLAGLNLALGLPATIPYEERGTVQADDGLLQKLAGIYQSAEKVRIDLRINDAGQLEVQDGHVIQPARIVAADAVTFDRNGHEALITFLDERNGHFDAVRYGYRILQRT